MITPNSQQNPKPRDLPPRKIIVGCDEYYTEITIVDQDTLRRIREIEDILPKAL